MPFDAFVKIDNIEGESTDSKHKGWIEVLDCGVNIKQTVSKTVSSSGGATAERATFDDFDLTKYIDKSSPELSRACAAGTHIDTIEIEFCRAGTEKLKFMGYRLRNCIISKVIMLASGDFPTETISINYGKIEWIYTQQKRQGGGAAGNVATGWDLQRNCNL